MEFTELGDYPIRSGAMTEWLPYAQSPWADDDRSVSFAHEAHLRYCAEGGREAWLGCAFDIAGALDVPAFRSALTSWIDRHELLRSHTSLLPGFGDTSQGGGAAADSAIRRQTVPVGGIHVGAVSHGYVTDAEANAAHLQQLFDEYASPFHWPSYVFATVESAEHDSFTVYFGADHSIIDGYSIVLIAHEVSALYREARGHGPADLVPVGSYVDFGSAERSAEVDHGTEQSARDVWRQVFDETGMPGFPLDIGPRSDGPQRGMSEWLLGAEESADFAAACRRAGVGFFAGVLASLGIAGTRVGAGGRFRAVTPVHTRDDPKWLAALGWFVGLFPIVFDVDHGEPAAFESVARNAQASLNHGRPAGAVPLDRIGGTLGVPIRPEFVVSYMDVRFVPRADEWQEWRAQALRSRQYTHDVHVWINRTPHGLNLAIRYPNNDTAVAHVTRWVSELRPLLLATTRG